MNFDWQTNDTLAQASKPAPGRRFAGLWRLNRIPDINDLPTVVKQIAANNLYHVISMSCPLQHWCARINWRCLIWIRPWLSKKWLWNWQKAGLVSKVDTITESAMRGEIDFAESFTRRVALLKGLSSEVLEDIIANHYLWSPGAKRLISALKIMVTMWYWSQAALTILPNT